MKRNAIATFLGAISLLALSQVAASAAVYDATADFSIGSNPNGVWAYGEGTAGSSFSAFTNAFSTGLGGPTNFWQSSAPVDLVPIVGKNVGSSAYNFGTVMAPTGVLWVHPGQGDDVLVQFTAPTAGEYAYSGSFELLDVNPSGVIGEVYNNGTSLYSGTLTGPGANQATLTAGQSESFSGTTYLAAGATLTFAVNNDGDFYNDSTGLSATVTAVPEVGTWAMLLVGFAGLGLAGVRRSRAAKLA